MEELVPKIYQRIDGQITEHDMRSEGCGNFAKPMDGFSRGFTNILSLDLFSSTFDYESDHLLSNHPLVYASTDALVLTENAWDWWWFWGQDDVMDKALMKSFNDVRAGQRRGGVVPSEIQALEPLVHEMRLIKSKYEISMMRKSAKISVDAHKRIFKNCKPGVFEYQIEADIIHEFGKHGAVPAYTSIVASGENACTLHYISNREKMKAGQLLLTDAGCEHEMYAADITRTIPISGKYNKEQKEIYELVLQVQKTAIDSVKPGKTFEDLQSEAIKGLTQGLKSLGLLKGRLDQLIKSEAYKDFYMHGIGHWLGMDVHDVGAYMDQKGKSRKFQPGMVLTIEPGIYISKKNKNVPSQYRGIGIRIEDDVLVTKNGCDVLTKALPKEIDEVESIMSVN